MNFAGCVGAALALTLSAGLNRTAVADPSKPTPKVDRRPGLSTAPPKVKYRQSSMLTQDGVKPHSSDAFIAPAEEKNWLAYQAALKKKKLISLDLMKVAQSHDLPLKGIPEPCAILHRYAMDDYEEVFPGRLNVQVATAQSVMPEVRFALNADGAVVCIAFKPSESGKVKVGVGCTGGGAYQAPSTQPLVVPKGTVVLPGLVEISAKQVTIEKQLPAGGCNIP